MTTSGQRIGYVRVSTLDQNTGRQLDGISLDQTFLDKMSSKDVDREQLENMMQFVRQGDTVVVHSMDRLALNLDDLRRIIQFLTNKGVRIEFVKESLSFTGDDSPMANLMLSVMGAFSEFERALIGGGKGKALHWQNNVAPITAENGHCRMLTSRHLSRVLLLGGQKAQIAREFGISRETLYQYLRTIE